MSALTEQEREAILATEGTTWANVFAAVELIVAGRERAAGVQALREAAGSLAEHRDWAYPYLVECQQWLRDRADRIENGEQP